MGNNLNEKSMRRMFGIIGIIYMAVCFVACSTHYAEVEKVAQDELEQLKEFYVVALQTGEVKLPLGNKYPHVTLLGPGGLETPMFNVWIVNGGAFGEIIECRGCDACMTHYQQAGLVSYEVLRRDSFSVTAKVWLTEKGKQFLIERHLENPHPILKAWRRRENWEMLMVGKEKFDVEIEPTEIAGVYMGVAHRSVEITPFLKAIGGKMQPTQKGYYQLKIQQTNEGKYKVTRERN